MDHRPDPSHPSSPERNPLGLGPRDQEGSSTGSVEDTSYNARGADPYTTGEPGEGPRPGEPSVPADPRVPSSDEP